MNSVDTIYRFLNGWMMLSAVLLVTSWKYRIKFKQLIKNYFTNDRTVSLQKYKTNTFVPIQSITEEAWIIFKLSIQMSLSIIFEVWVHSMSSFFLGRLPNSKQALAVSSIATSYTYVAAITWSWGFCHALWTLIPQAVGAKQNHLIALYIQRAIFICFCIQIPLSFSLFYGGNILDFIGFTHENDITSDMINNYCRALIPYPYLMVALSCLHRIEQNLNYNYEMMIIQGIGFFLAIPLHYIFINILNIGYVAGGLVNSLNLLFVVILNTLFLIHKGYGYIFKPLSIKQICDKNGLYNYLSLAWPGTIRISLTWIIKHSTIMLFGFIPSNDKSVTVAASVIMKNLNQVRSVYVGVANASALRMGKYIGSNSIYYAKRCFKIQLCYMGFVMMIVSTVFILFKDRLPYIFTHDKDIGEMASKLIYIGLFNQLVWVIYRNTRGIFKALGYQKYSAYITFISQYLLAFPLQLYLLFVVYAGDTEMGLFIVWTGQSFGYVVANILVIGVLMFWTDWDKAIQDKNRRIKMDNRQFKKTTKTPEICHQV